MSGAPQPFVTRAGGIAGWTGVVLLCGCAVLAGLLELFLVPLYDGSVLVPVAVLMAVLGNVAFPLMGRVLVSSTVAAVLPFAAWLVVVIIVGLSPRAKGDVVLPAGGGVQWVAYGVLLLGAGAGVAAIVLSTPPPTPRRQPQRVPGPQQPISP